MRTTLNIDDDVLQAAEEIARRRNSTTGKVLSELARVTLTGEPVAADSVDEATPFFGFRPFSAAGRVVSNEAVDRLRGQLGI